jgi:AcrR family transcriptional regulator
MLAWMPRLWTDTIETHRREVRAAILETTAALVAEHGLTAVAMSQIAAQAGIGRATLYKYFPDVEAILVAWHEQHVARHLERLATVRDRSDESQRLEAVLEAYALILLERSRKHAPSGDAGHAHRKAHGGRAHQDPGGEIAALVHRRDHVARAERKLSGLIAGVLKADAEAGRVRDDVSPDELARYCLHALAAAAALPSKSAVRRLVAVTLAGLRPAR